MHSSDIFSKDRRHRYELRYTWDVFKPVFVAIMLNPSVATRYRLDPTCTRIFKRAAHSGFGSFVIGNVGAFVATDPTMWRKSYDPIGPDNYKHIERLLREVRLTDGVALAGWGNLARPEEVIPVVDLAIKQDVLLMCLGTTASGAPLHPLYVPDSARVRAWRVNV